MGKTKSKKEQKPPGKCIFCGNSGNLTKQHVFSNMLKQYIPRTQKGSRHYFGSDGFKKASELQKQIPHKVDKGDMGVRQIRNVCSICNSEWINSIEQELKTLLGELILGEEKEIPDQKIASLVNWIAITTIMGENTHISDRAIHKDERKKIREEGKPSENWLIWIGEYSGKETQLYRHATHIPLEPKDLEIPGFSACDRLNNCQCTVMIHGKLFIVAATIPAASIRGIFLEQIKNFSQQLIPITPKALKNLSLLNRFFGNRETFAKIWPAQLKVNDNDLLAISNAMPEIGKFMERNGIATNVRRIN
ncbi:hypothetical protein L0657_11780 [Dyadobacter sp. CY345]|uniref:hypothetical protein n=1 Tax=Dyadobacter sp. CY345 TaxID=2909335 RepID=UPI001F3F7387|nr:hypothetical protein [Dyadobacter sp. CY345]MCF2444638.1 hypothetical protein [Dyadobacter sp. CY345]